MADNTTLNSGTGGDVIASDDIGGVKYQRVKLVEGADGTNDGDISSANPLPVEQIGATPAGSNNIGDVDVLTLPALPTGSNVIGQVTGSFKTCSTDVTLPTSSIYAINDCISDSTSAPTTGGFTFTDAARVSGGSGIITDAIISSSADVATLLQGEVWIFNTAVTNVNDNAPFVVSDSEIKTCVGKIPFTLEDAGNNGFYHATNLNIGFTCSGSANLRFLIRAKNTYTPATDVLTFVIKVIRVD